MPMTDLLLIQLTDIFRVGLIIGLLATAHRTRSSTGLAMPLVLGVAFIAAMIPMTLPAAATAAVPLWQNMAVGLVSNAILLAGAMGGWALVQRLRS